MWFCTSGVWHSINLRCYLRPSCKAISNLKIKYWIIFRTKQGVFLRWTTSWCEGITFLVWNFLGSNCYFHAMCTLWTFEVFLWLRHIFQTKALLLSNTKRCCFAVQLFFGETPNHFKMAMSHVTEQFAKKWYNQEVDPTSEDRDPKHAKINRTHVPTIVKSFDRNKRPIHRVTFIYYIAVYFIYKKMFY